MSEPTETPADDKRYDAQSVEQRSTERWLAADAFAAVPDDRENRYVVMMPLPNVTGSLHMGHAMDNVMQDMLTRWHRMQGDNTLWMAGTDHAGISTQAVVEKRLKELEGKTRHDIGREALVKRIWEWKDTYQARIVEQQRAMGCGCDWERQRFTMDAVCARAVRHMFFHMFRDGLIYQGDRLVNWDCQLQTAVADDELYKETVHGSFWHLRYPVLDPRPGEPEYVVVATTRPETMLGDTAVACHPEPKRALEKLLEQAREKAATAKERDKAAANAEVKRLTERLATDLPRLEQAVAMARAGRKLKLPLMDREIPLILDEWAKPELGSGCVKITPAHDPNDYEVWGRHKDAITAINVLESDGKMSAAAGQYKGLDRFEARTQVVAAMDKLGFLDRVEERDIEIDHSDRSKTIIEPLLSKQWFVRMGDVDGGVTMGRGTEFEFKSPGLAQAAIDATSDQWTSGTGRRVEFHPDPQRYRGIYTSWLAEKRDWCISRQLWWGHRIPVWRGTMERSKLLSIAPMLRPQFDRDDVAGWIVMPDGERVAPGEGIDRLDTKRDIEEVEVQLCFLDEAMDTQIGSLLQSAGLELDPDVLDTWFSSALWPHSTLGWPDPKTAKQDEGQRPLVNEGGPNDGNDALSYYYPGSCLVTGRDIITLWVARMVIAGLYNLGDVPFTDVFLHATILDGKGERMSKSKGNGIDPVDIIEHYGADAMRYVVCEMQTGTQDVRLPVYAISPFDGELVELATAKVGPHQGTYLDPSNGKPFDVVGLMESEGVPQAKAVSKRFDVGRAFCTKLWNGARFAFLNLEDLAFTPLTVSELATEDRWILSRLAAANEAIDEALEQYTPANAITAAREFFWSELCDWYLEMIKPRMHAESTDAQSAAVAKQVLAHVLDQALRLLHPFVPFITESLWERLGELAPKRGIAEPLEVSELLTLAAWPKPAAATRDELLETQVAFAQRFVTKIREVRASYNLKSRDEVAVQVRASGASADALNSARNLITGMACISTLEVTPDAQRAKNAASTVIDDIEAFVLDVVDPATERKKLDKQKGKLEGELNGLTRKLGNEGFLAKAPPAVVEKETQRAKELEQQIESLSAGLRALDE